MKRVGLALAAAWVIGVVLLFLFYESFAAGRTQREITVFVRTVSSVMLSAACALFVLGYLLEKRRELTELLAVRKRQLEQLKRLARRMAEQEAEAAPSDENGRS